MKKYLIIFLLILLSLSGCLFLEELTQFNMEYSESMEIPSTFGINLPFNLFTPAIETNSETTFAINDTRKDLIEEISLTTLRLTLTSPSNADFSFLKSIEIYMSTDSLPEIKIAWKNEIPNDLGTILDLETGSEDLKDYIKEDDFGLRINTVTDELLMTTHTLDLYSVFFVDARILGQ